MSEEKQTYGCEKCSKKYKNIASLEKHKKKCTSSKKTPALSSSPVNEIISDESDNNKSKENNYDVNMTFVKGNKIEVEVKKHPNEDDEGYVFKEILKPKISSTYQEEIDKLNETIKMIQDYPVSEDEKNKDFVIKQLKNTLALVLRQSQNLIKEMKTMSKRNNYLKNNIMLAAFILDRCRKDTPETEEDFNEMFGVDHEKSNDEM